MSVVLMAYHNMGCIGLEVLRAHGVDVAAVFTYRDSEDENIWFDSVAELSTSRGIDTFYAREMTRQEIFERVRDYDPDVLFSFYYRDLLPRTILDIPRLGAMNLHGSLLPRYRGRCPVNWQIINGETRSGVTLHHMVEEADAGDIVAQEEVAVDDRETAHSLFLKLQQAARRLLDDNIDDIVSGRSPRIAQDHSQATVFGGRGPEDGLIDWDSPRVAVDNLVRGVTRPYPGAYTMLGDNKLIIWEAEPVDERNIPGPEKAGHIVQYENRLYGKAGDGWLQLDDYECSDKNGKPIELSSAITAN